MNKAVAIIRDGVRAQLWPLPMVAVGLAFAAAIVLPEVDAEVGGRLPGWVVALLFGGDASAARALLDAIATSMITVTSLTFSLTVVTLQLASGQFSPRLLRTFTSDLVVQAALAFLLATFTFALTLLRTVRSADTGAEFVPRISTTVAFALTLASVVTLVLFLAHLARQIRVETMLRDVHEDATETLSVCTSPRRTASESLPLPEPPADSRRLRAARSGFITSIDEAALLAAAHRADTYLTIDRHPGNSIVAGVPIGSVWRAAGPMDDDVLERLQRDVDAAIDVGYERTAAQDVGYGLRQLTDVANKALSPGINDPTTAIHALGHISAVLCQLAARDLDPVLLRDDDGRVRVVLRRRTFAELVDDALAQPRRYGSSDPLVVDRLFGVLEELAWHVPTEGDAADVADAVREQLDRLGHTVANSDFDGAEHARFQRAEAAVRRVLSTHASGDHS